MIDSLRQDLVYAVRTLLRSRGVTVVAVLALALGIGANTAMFTLLNAILLVPMPVREPGRVVTLYTSDFSGPAFGTSSHADYLDFRKGTASVFEDVAAHGMATFVARRAGESFRVSGETVTGNLFALAGVPVALGRGIGEPDEVPGAPMVIVLSDAFWRRRFGADPSVIGQSMETVDGRSATIVGITAPGFPGLTRGIRIDVWLPLTPNPNRTSRGLRLLARLKPEADVAQAQAALATVARRLHQEHPEAWTDRRGEPRRVSVLPEKASRVWPVQMRAPVLRIGGVLFAIVGLVLLIACANVAGLLLARAVERRREIAVRLSMGAGRWRLVRQLLTESLLLAFVAAAVGLAFSVGMTRLVAAVALPPQVDGLAFSPDTRVLGFTLLLGIGAAVAFGLTPALQATRATVAAALRQGAAGTPPRSRLRGGLVVAQVALSALLLVGSGLFMRSLSGIDATDLGFDATGVVVAPVDLGAIGQNEAQARETFRRLLERLRGLPGVTTASLASNLSFDSHGGGRRGVTVDGYVPQPGEDMEVRFNVVSAGYFETVRTPIVRGRSFREDDAGPDGVVIVNEAFAARFWPGEDPIGKRLRQGPDRHLTVVGVTATGKYREVGEAPTPYVYYHERHTPRYWPKMRVFVRTDGDVAAMAAQLRHEIRTLVPALPVPEATPLTAAVRDGLREIRAASAATGVFGGVALLLTLVGLYGVVAYTVSRRTREIGVRMALGADRAEIRAMVVGQGLRLVGGGVLLGLFAAAGAARLVRFLLYGVHPLDPLTYAGIAALMLAAGASAAWIPALRASRMSPATSLRYE